MGGGDLNQKKSWHPHTLKNQERVWKAEQAKNLEDKKLKDLRKEIVEERNREELKRLAGGLMKCDEDKQLDWMYKNSTQLINREEYLLGRSIDKSFEQLHAEEQQKEKNLLGVKAPINHVEHECVPFSMRSFQSLESTTEQVDYQRKVLEDPLMLIQQREMESRRKILENPVKLKELHRILKKDQVMKKVKKSKKSKKSKKKHKKRSKSSSNSSDSNNGSDSDDLDQKLEKHYKKLKGTLETQKPNALKDLELTKLLDAKFKTISQELDKAAKTRIKSKRNRSSSEGSERSPRRSKHRNERSERRNRSSSGDRKRSPRKSKQRNERSERRNRSSSDNSERSSKGLKHRNQRSERRSRSRSPQKRNRRHNDDYDRRGRTHSRSRSPSPRYNRDRYDNRRQVTSAKNIIVKSGKEFSTNRIKKLTEEEKEDRRREMMENASWREADRSKAVQKHRDAYAREVEHNQARDFDKNFINQEVKKAIANHNSVGSRIRANLNNIQRSSSAMDTNFARK